MSQKLEFWQSLVKSGHRKKKKKKGEEDGDGDGEEDDSKLSRDLREFQCDVATNSEICHIGERGEGGREGEGRQILPNQHCCRQFSAAIKTKKNQANGLCHPFPRLGACLVVFL